MENDVQLINKIVSGDDESFGILMRKYYKDVHSFVWKKVGDFHFAEDITQDIFIQVYRKISTLKDPRHFSKWLYVIANRLCINWLQRNRYSVKSLENMSDREIGKLSYAHYISDQREIAASEHYYEVIEKVLGKLPDRERIVMELYYIRDMTTKEISEYLDVSVNTITSQLQRARKRLQNEKIVELINLEADKY